LTSLMGILQTSVALRQIARQTLGPLLLFVQCGTLSIVRRSLLLALKRHENEAITICGFPRVDMAVVEP